MKDILTNPFAAVHRRSRTFVSEAPSDLLAVAGFAALATVLIVAVPSTLVRAAVGLPLLFFLPGYVTVSFFFPRSSPVKAEECSASTIAQTRDLSGVERVALSFGLSLALLPLLGLAVGTGPWGITASTVAGAVGGFVLAGTVPAVARRVAVPPDERFQFRFGRRLRAAYDALFRTESSMHAAVNVVLVCSMLLAMTTVGYGLVAPQQGESYTSLQLLTEDESGELVASGYPESIDPGESIPLVMTVENREGQDVNYTVVVQEQRVENGEITERTELRTLEYVLNDGATGHGEREITPSAEDGLLRISVQVYVGDVPETPTHDDAYRYAYFWTEVTGDGDDAVANETEID